MTRFSYDRAGFMLYFTLLLSNYTVIIVYCTVVKLFKVKS